MVTDRSAALRCAAACTRGTKRRPCTRRRCCVARLEQLRASRVIRCTLLDVATLHVACCKRVAVRAVFNPLEDNKSSPAESDEQHEQHGLLVDAILHDDDDDADADDDDDADDAAEEAAQCRASPNRV